MLFAISTTKFDERILAKPGLVGICPDCGERVIAKCGEVNRWHWCHTVMTDCKSAKETEWHQKWKRYMGLNNAEQVVIRNGIRKRADTLLPHGTVVEYQNSPITPSEVIDRMDHYGKMIWIFNLWQLCDKIIIRDMTNDHRGEYPQFHIARDVAYATSNPDMLAARRLRLILPRMNHALAAINSTETIYFLDLNREYLFNPIYRDADGKYFDGRLYARKDVKTFLIKYDERYRPREFFA